ERLDHRDHLGNMLGRARVPLGRLDVQALDVAEEGVHVLHGEVVQRKAFLARAADRLVVHVGQVHDLRHAQPAGEEVPAQDVLEQERPQVADVDGVVDRRSARVHPDVPGLERRQLGRPASERVVKGDRAHRPALRLARSTFFQVSSRFSPLKRWRKRKPFKWSISWHRARARSPVPSTSRISPEASAARTLTTAGRTTFSAMSGTERHPSSSPCSAETSTISGLARTRIPPGSWPTERSMIATRMLTPIWGAARPIPGAAWQVSIMSERREAKSGER